MELRRYLRLIQQRLFIVILAVIAGAAVGYVTTSHNPVYTGTATIYVGQTDVTSPQALYEEPALNEVANTFSQMIPAPVIAQRAVRATHIKRFSGEVAAATTATVVLNTYLINVSVTDSVPSDAVRLTNGVARAFVAQIAAYQKNPTASSAAIPNVPAHVYQPATVAIPSSSQTSKHLILGALFGLILSIFLILLLDYLDITIKSPDELERRVGLPVLGIIPRFESLRLDSSPNAGLQRPRSGGGRG
ncbi:MAG TPA: Wzz/FepE/Etk N-terminal domain-containing protein [Acidimicrobiales bacterium]|jgi:receptor protein-tyrosine kinase|nr:Wzz/FepE/Etk N-terminal domain-containing protein [Acidimicrobiales bacterium]